MPLTQKSLIRKSVIGFFRKMQKLFQNSIINMPVGNVQQGHVLRYLQMIQPTEIGHALKLTRPDIKKLHETDL